MVEIKSDIKIPNPKKVMEFGNRIENFLIDFLDVFKYVSKDVGKVVSSKSDLIIENVPKQKLGLYLIDYVGISPILNTEGNIINIDKKGKTLFELKSLQVSYKDCLSLGWIPLTKNKITGLEGEFYPKYYKENGIMKVRNIYNAKWDYQLKKFIPRNTDDRTLKRNDWDYWAIYFLQDGIYYYDILKDPNLKLDYYDCGSFKNYKKVIQHGREHYCIPIQFLKQMPQEVFNKIFQII